MFTGIVEEMGVVEKRLGGRFRFRAPAVSADASIGDSIAVNGCCLTVVERGPDWWEADVVPESLARTNLDDLGPGDRVNLERPVRLSDRLGGHLVQGHVDGVGTIVSPAPDLEVEAPAALRRYLVEKGSITVDGCSLTVVRPTGRGFQAALIPHTTDVTVLGRKGPGDRVNLEVDVIAKYTERLLTYVSGPTEQEA
jgi:riboflavin synthase